MLKELDKYMGFVQNAIKEVYAYKFRAFIWVLYDFVFLFVEYFLWKAIFEANGGVFYNVSLNQYISYIVIGLLVSRIARCGIDMDVAHEVKSGNVVMNLLKPYSYLRMYFAKHIGYTVGSLFNMIPVLIVIYFMGGFENISLQIGFVFGLSLLFAFIIGFLFSMFIGLLAFWLTNIWGLTLFKWNLVAIFSGQMIALNLVFKIGREGFSNMPISFMSEGLLQKFFLGLGYVSYALPFQAMSYTPSAIYTGMIVGNSKILMHLALQVFWVVVMTILIKTMWNKAQSKLTVMGG